MNVDLSGPVYTLYMKARQSADKARKAGDNIEAANQYLTAARWMKAYAEYSGSAEVRKERMGKYEQLVSLAHRLGADYKEPKPTSKADKATTREPLATIEGEDDYEEEVLRLIHKSDIKWSDIGGLEETKNEIISAYAIALAKKPEGVKVSSWRNLLLYGPPGTGKTLLAAATAGNLDATFFNVKVSSLLSKYFGESTKLVSALYSVARRLAPAVIFLDEFESLTPARGSGESGAERRIISTLLAELDGLQSKSDNAFVLTIAATNLPWLLDLAILSRFQKRILVPLPDEAARKAILNIQLARRGFTTQLSEATLIEKTAGFAGREIEQFCIIAINNMIRRSNPQILETANRGLDEISAYQLNIDALNEGDFALASAQVKPVTDKTRLAQFTNWGQEHQE
ncbi:MAG: ATP-binding protein [Chloroflexi bacterium]|nr:ATP-binding protein [Chloroflexota bacterium]